MKKSTPKTLTSKKPITKAVTSKTRAKTPVTKASVKKAAPKTRVTNKKTAAKKAVTMKATTKTKVTAKKPAATTKPVITKKLAIAKKQSAAKKRATAKKAATPKTALKKAVSKKATIKKPIAKTIGTKAAPQKKPAVKAVTHSTKADLRKTIASLESRMKRADTLTRKSVKALESAVMTLDARTRKDNNTSKAALTRKVNQLSTKLTDMVAKTQAEINSDLKTALETPSVENVQAALLRADQRMSDAEHTQAAAITKVNRHLSAIATAVDTRIEDEAKARQAAIAALQTQTQNSQAALTSRIDTIEADTAQALSRVGNKISDLSSELTQRGTSSELSIREKISEIALQTQTEFETYRAGLERRIDDVAQTTRKSDTQHLEHTITALTTRLESLEFAVANQAPAELTAPQPTPAPAPAPAQSTPQLSLVQTVRPSQTAAPLTLPQAAEPQAASHTPQLPDAFSPISRIAEASPAAAMSNPYLTGHAETAPVIEEPTEAPEGHHPVEFNPNQFKAKKLKASLPPPPAPVPTSAPIDEPLRDFTQTDVTPVAPPMVDLEALPPLPADGNTTPYADPAYAEADETLAEVRIGSDTAPKLNLPKLSGRNLRAAAIATGVVVVGLVAAKGVFGNNGASTPLPQQTAQKSLQPESIVPSSIPTPNTSLETIGNYADNKSVELAPSSDAAKTLNSAASSGDSVAQFQLGISYLEQGRTDEGVALIRKSANQNQPAAQYRLAKLYEIGEGVSQDSEMARQLTERAATNGNRIAMHDFALYYAEGRGGVEADLPTAAKWFEKAAERGVVDSQFNLGVLFESGQGLPKNMTDAFVWYSIAAKQGDQFAKTRVEVLQKTMEQSDLLSAAERVKQFTPRKIDEAANGIFRSVAWAKPTDDVDKQVSQIKQVQTMLTELGYDIGGADGSIGPKTRAAIISFERVNSLPETGRVNSALADRLELATGA